MSDKLQAKTKPNSSDTFTVSGLLQRKCACGTHTVAGGECEACGRKHAQTKLVVNQPGDAYEREADRVADAVVGNQPGLGGIHASFASVPATRLQRDEPPKQKSNEEKYQDAAKKIGEAFLETELGKKITEGAKDAGESFVKTLPGAIITGAAAGAAIATIIAKHKELPIGIPEIPLDKIKPGLKVKLTYEGPVDKPTKAMITFSYSAPKSETKKPAMSATEKYRAETARIAAEQAKFREGLKSQKEKDREKAQEQELLNAYLQKHLPGAINVTKPHTDDKTKKKHEDTLLMRKESSGDHSPADAPSSVHELITSPGQPLDAATRIFMESRFGYDFSRVRVHTDEKAAQSTRHVNALAYTVGHHIVFRPGKYSPHTTAGKHLLAHELTHVLQQSNQASKPPSIQRKVMLKGAEMLKKERAAFIKARKWDNGILAQAIIEDMAAATDIFDFADEHELESEIIKRISTTKHMKESQETVEKVPGDKQQAFGYPFSGQHILYGPRVNYAARDYWEPPPPDGYAVRTDKKKNKELMSLPRHERFKVYGDQGADYGWKLTAKGKANPYEAIKNLFVVQPPHKRTLIHCDYLVSMVNFLSFADSIGVAEFNKRVKAYGVDKISLRWNAFQDLEAEFFETVKVGGKDTQVKKKGLGSLQRVVPSSESDLVIGDHVLFFNHIAYDPLNQNIGNAWRLENAVLIGKDSKGIDIFLGHGSGRRNADELRIKLAHEFNIVAEKALAFVEKAKSKDAKIQAQGSADLSKHFPNVKLVSSEWRIQGKSDLCVNAPVTVNEKLRLIKPKEVLGPHSPCDPSKMFPVDRPIESEK